MKQTDHKKKHKKVFQTQVTCNNGVFGDTLTVCLLPFGVRTVTAVPLAAIVRRDVAMFIWINFIDTLRAGFKGSFNPLPLEEILPGMGLDFVLKQFKYL